MPKTREKAPSTLINQRGGRGAGLVVSGERPVAPALPAGWIRAKTKGGRFAHEAWERFWRSPAALAVEPDADYERLLHWVRCIDERERIKAQIEGEGQLVPGSMGQKVRHPLAQDIAVLNREIREIAAVYGMTPMSRFRLQIHASDAERKRRKLIKPGNEAPASAPVEREARIVDGDEYVPDEEPVEF